MPQDGSVSLNNILTHQNLSRNYLATDLHGLNTDKGRKRGAVLETISLIVSPIISERGKTAKTGDSEKMDAETAFWEERGEGAAATLGKFANDLGLNLSV